MERREGDWQVGDEKRELEKEKDSPSLAADHPACPSGTTSAMGAAAMSHFWNEATRASDQKAEEEYVWVPSPPRFVARHLEDLEDALLCSEGRPAHETQNRRDLGHDYADAASPDHRVRQYLSISDPRANRSHGECSEAGSSVDPDPPLVCRMSSGACHIHRTQEHRVQLYAYQTELEGQREWEATREETDAPPLLFSVSQFEDGEAAGGSGHVESNDAKVVSQGAGLARPSSPVFVPGQMEDLEDALEDCELADDCHLCHRRSCPWTKKVEQELWPLFPN